MLSNQYTIDLRVSFCSETSSQSVKKNPDEFFSWHILKTRKKTRPQKKLVLLKPCKTKNQREAFACKICGFSGGQTVHFEKCKLNPQYLYLKKYQKTVLQCGNQLLAEIFL